MPVRVRPIGAARLEVTFNFPIDARSRSVVDHEMDKLRHSVIPIIGANARRKPYLVGGAVALIHRGRKMLVTAEHVFSDNEAVPLSLFAYDSYSRPLIREFEESKEHDLAARMLSESETEALSHVPFIPEGSLGRATVVGDSFYASVVGYPASAAKRKDILTLDTPMDVYSNFAMEQPDGSVSVAFDKKEGAVGVNGHINPRDPIGKSGGAIFAMQVVGLAIKSQVAKLVGIPTHWDKKHKLIRGSTVTALVPLLDRAVGAA